MAQEPIDHAKEAVFTSCHFGLGNAGAADKSFELAFLNNEVVRKEGGNLQTCKFKASALPQISGNEPPKTTCHSWAVHY